MGQHVRIYSYKQCIKAAVDVGFVHLYMHYIHTLNVLY